MQRVLWWFAVVWLAGCGRLGFDAGAPSDAGDAGSVSRAVLLHVDQTDVQEQLAEFPLLVVLDDQRIDRSRLRGDARDLQFSLDGKPLAYEIEDPGTPGGDPVVAWVRVPQLFGRATVIRLDYGSGDPAPAPADPVWSRSYAAVFHLAEASGVARDATGHYPAPKIAEVGTPSPPSPVRGRIGLGRGFQSMFGNAIQVDAQDLMYSPFTVSGWLYETTLPAEFHALVSREHFGAGDNVFWIGDFRGTYRGALMCSSGPSTLTATGPGSTAMRDTWVHLALVMTLTEARLYVDGQLSVAQSVSGLPAAGNENPINLGADNNIDAPKPGADLLDGRLDEVRIETVARSAEWLRVDHLAMLDQLIRYEAVVP